MWKAIKYIFYKAYKFYKYEMGDNTPEFMGITVVAGLISFLLIAILNFLGFTGWFTYLNKLTWFILILLFLAFWLYIFYHNKNWKNIIKEFENESDKQRKRGKTLVVLYAIFTIILFITSLFFIK